MPRSPRALVALYVVGGDDHNDLRFLFHRHEHTDLAVRLEPGKNPGGVEIVEQLAAEFQIQLAAKLPDPLADALGLEHYVLIVVKTQTSHISSSSRPVTRRSGPTVQAGAGGEIFHGAAHGVAAYQITAITRAKVDVLRPLQGDPGEGCQRDGHPGQLQPVPVQAHVPPG